MTPKRIQLRRTKGWRKPAGAVVVDRRTRWGNPYTAGGDRAVAVALFVDMLDRAPRNDDGDTVYTLIQRDLASKDLACWCPLDQPCHADVLLEIANGGDA